MINTYLLTDEELDALILIVGVEELAITDSELNKKMKTGLLKNFSVDLNNAVSIIVDDYKFIFESSIEKRSKNILNLCRTGE